MTEGLVIGTVVVAVLSANATVALRIRRILRLVAGLDQMHVARPGAFWRYQVASLLALAAAAVIYLMALIHSV